MQYISTRGQAPILDFEHVLMAGLASDGGLYVPETYPTFDIDMVRKAAISPYVETAFRVMQPYIAGAIGDSDFYDILDKTYKKFRHPAVVPLSQIGSSSWLLELYHGPTLAFKDVALCLLGKLFEYFLQKKGETLTIIGATSGDTGSAAIQGLRGLDHVRVFIFYPKGRTSDVQRKQMTTVADKNVHAIAVDGTFDDCQAIVKTLFADQEFRKKCPIGAVNSINWARVMAQIVYYVTSASALGAPARGCSFSVPTGNFGDILAGYIASRSGLPIHKLAIATNSNNILSRCYHSGAYHRGDVMRTESPSMDIQVSSNFERLLFDLYDRNADEICNLHADLKHKNGFTLGEKQLQRFRGLFLAESATDEETFATIKNIYEKTDRLIDPHSAVGVTVAQKLGLDQKQSVPVVNLACAAAAKFPDFVEKATGVHPDLPAHLADLHQREERTTHIPNDIEAVKVLLIG